MTRSRSRRAERGSTLIEVMVATLILTIAGGGFAATSQYAAGATGVGHRRTTSTLLRGSLVDRLNVTPRSVLRAVAAANKDTWLVDGCHDERSQRLDSNTTFDATFECPEGTYYRSWIKVTDNDNGDGAWAATTNAWSVAVYVERVDPGCTAELREGSVACVSADLLLTD